jgi:hypothetical protein
MAEHLTDNNMIMCDRECGRPALTSINGMWVCGECAAKIVEKLREKNRKMMLEE